VWIELLWLAVLSAFWPTLIAVDVLAFHTPNPERILVSFLAGGLLATVTIGTIVVLNLQQTALVTSSASTTNPALNLTVGGLSLFAALALGRMPASTGVAEPAAPRARPRLAERMVERGAALAFAGGILLNLVPGIFPLIALKDIAQLDYSAAATVGILVVFYAIMFAFVEIPIVGYVVASEWTERQVNASNAWLRANRRQVAMWVLVVGGVYLVVRGIVQLA
jgi:hypothetical protein